MQVALGTIDPALYLTHRASAISWLTSNNFVAPLEITVYWGDQDANSHVSNVRYFSWLENGRIGVLKYFDGPKAANGKGQLFQIFGSSGERLLKCLGAGTGYILGKVANTYVKPVFAPDHLMLGHTVSNIGEKKFEVKTLMYSFR